MGVRTSVRHEFAMRTARGTGYRAVRRDTSTCSPGCCVRRGSTSREADGRPSRSRSTSSTSRGDPAMKNHEALRSSMDPDFVTELGQWNIEINVAPRWLPVGGGITPRSRRRSGAVSAPRRRADVARTWSSTVSCRRAAQQDVTPDQLLSSNSGGTLLNEQVLAARGEGPVDLHQTAWSGCTSPPARSCRRRPAPARSRTCR